jgi:hypothetical protein
MKSLSLVLGLFVFSLIVNAQESGKNAVVASVNMNVLYRGIANPIEIAVSGVTTDKVTATVTNGTINRTTNGWEVLPGDQLETAVTILVDNRKVSEKKFRVKNIPNPVAVFAGKSEGSLDKDVALKTDDLDVELKDFLWDLKFTIESFVFCVSKDNMDHELKSGGNKLTAEMKSFIAGCESGKMIVFEDIKSISPDGRLKELNDIVLTIK